MILNNFGLFDQFSQLSRLGGGRFFHRNFTDPTFDVKHDGMGLGTPFKHFENFFSRKNPKCRDHRSETFSKKFFERIST